MLIKPTLTSLSFDFIKSLLIVFCTFSTSLNAGWFEDNYYEISYKFSSSGFTQRSMTIGKPWSEGPFTVYISYPDKKEIKIKTEYILKIIDTGTKSPDEVKNEKFQKMEKIFGRTPEDLKNNYTRPNIDLARSMKISNKEIYDFLCIINEEYKSVNFPSWNPSIENYITPKRVITFIDEPNNTSK